METVLSFLNELTLANLPTKITIHRSRSRYLFYLTCSVLAKRLQRQPSFFKVTEANPGELQGLIEEHSLLGGSEFFVLDGCSRSFVDRLSPIPGVVVLAETDQGAITPDPFTAQSRKALLKLLSKHFEFDHRLRSLQGLDWYSCRSYAEVEAVLRRAKLCDWSLEDFAEALKQTDRVEMLVALKKGQYQAIFELADTYGASWALRHMGEILIDLQRYKAWQVTGLQDSAIYREMELSRWQFKEVVETAATLTSLDISELLRTLVHYDGLARIAPDLALNLLVLTNSITVKRF